MRRNLRDCKSLWRGRASRLVRSQAEPGNEIIVPIPLREEGAGVRGSDLQRFPPHPNPSPKGRGAISPFSQGETGNKGPCHLVTRSPCHPVTSARAGFTLIEMLVVMVGLGVLMTLMATTLLATVRLQRAEDDFFQGLLSQSQLADQFRTDVAGSPLVPERWNEFQAGPHCLILQKAEELPVVYLWHPEQQKLQRWDFSGGRKLGQVLSVGGDEVTVQFQRSASPELCTMRLIGPTSTGSLRPRFIMEIAAALGGEAP